MEKYYITLSNTDDMDKVISQLSHNNILIQEIFRIFNKIMIKTNLEPSQVKTLIREDIKIELI